MILASHEAFCDSTGKSGKPVRLPDTDFRSVPGGLKGRRLSGLAAPNSIFFGMNLQGVQLQGADLSGCDLRGANLKMADLRGARLTDALLTRADLRGAKLGPLSIDDGRVVRTDLSRAILTASDHFPVTLDL